MIRLGSLWYNYIYWSRFETLSSYKSAAISHLVIIRLACTKANSYSNFVTHPPSLWRSVVVLCINKVGGLLLVVRLSLRCDFPQAFGVACVLPSYSFALILSDPAVRRWGDKKGSANTLVLPHGSGAISVRLVFLLYA